MDYHEFIAVVCDRYQAGNGKRMESDALSFIRDHPEGCVCELRVNPGSSRSRLEGINNGGIAVSVHSPPEKGRANREALRLLSSFLGIPPSRLEVLSGRSSRNKSLLLRGMSSLDAARLFSSLPRDEG